MRRTIVFFPFESSFKKKKKTLPWPQKLGSRHLLNFLLSVHSFLVAIPNYSGDTRLTLQPCSLGRVDPTPAPEVAKFIQSEPTQHTTTPYHRHWLRIKVTDLQGNTRSLWTWITPCTMKPPWRIVEPTTGGKWYHPWIQPHLMPATSGLFSYQSIHSFCSGQFELGLKTEGEEFRLKQFSHLSQTDLNNCPPMNEVIMWKKLEMPQEK